MCRRCGVAAQLQQQQQLTTTCALFVGDFAPQIVVHTFGDVASSDSTRTTVCSVQQQPLQQCGELVHAPAAAGDSMVPHRLCLSQAVGTVYMQPGELVGASHVCTQASVLLL